MNEEIEGIKKSLQSFYAVEGPERCGFIYKDLTCIETENVCPDANNGFVINPDDVIKHLPHALAVWHTHPGGKQYTNLSVEDYRNCRDWPDLIHFIVSKDMVKAYQWEEDKKAVMEL